MTSFLPAVKRILSDKKTSLAIIALSITGRIIQLIYFFNLRLDASHQVIATKNFLAGHGISMAKAYANDISEAVYDPLINWPPGYSLLLAPFYALFNGNYIAAGLTLGILTAVALIFVTRGILRLLAIPLYLINIFTLITGFFIYFFYFIASSDAVTISFAMIAIYYALALIQSTDQRGKKTLLITLCLLICGAVKYLFIPVVLVIPVFIAWKGYSTKNKRLVRSGLLSTLCLLVAFAAILAWQKSISGSATYISEPGRGFFPDHLLSFFPFIPGSFIKPDTVMMLMPGNSLSSVFIFSLFQLLHFVLFIFFTFLLVRKFFKQGIKNSSAHTDFFYLTLLISWTITLLLAALSLQVEREAWQGGHLWTYIEEQRYYGWPMVMIQLAAFACYHHYREKMNKWIRYGLIFLFLLMTIEMIRGMIFDAKRVINAGKEQYSWQSEYRLQRYADNLIRESLRKRPAEKVVVGGPFYYVNHRVSLYSDAPLLDNPKSLNNLRSLNTTKSTLLLVILSEKDKAAYQSFLRSGIEVAGQFNGLYFYIVYVEPR